MGVFNLNRVNFVKEACVFNKEPNFAVIYSYGDNMINGFTFIFREVIIQ